MILKDKTTGKDILETTEGIKPRFQKKLEEQKTRTKQKAEVFTPSWICNAQNNLIDNAWFGRENVFNFEKEKSWVANPEKIKFGGKTWQDYVMENRMEITCGEAPYLVSRYDSSTGATIPLNERIGLLDRKIRVVNENTQTEKDWIKWVAEAYKSTYGFEYQADNLYIARKNLLETYREYKVARFDKEPNESELEQIAEIICWNIWQMDGLKYTIPNTEIYCLIKDWKENRVLEFRELLKEEK